ncbi:TPA: hypothetical protein ACXNPK_002498 [Proteus mirabilis]
MKKMPYKDPNNMNWFTALLIAGMAGWSGAALVSALEKRFLRKVAGE